jgi:WD40 repeat protein
MQSRIVAALSNGSLAVWSTDGSKPPSIVYGAHQGAVLCIASHSNGLIATGGADRCVQFWEGSSCKRLESPCMHGSAVLHTAFSPDGAALVAVGSGGELMVWACPKVPVAA